MEFAPRSLVPIFGVRGLPLFAMQIRVDSHPIFGFKFVDQ
jgi:hypothetical protein